MTSDESESERGKERNPIESEGTGNEEDLAPGDTDDLSEELSGLEPLDLRDKKEGVVKLGNLPLDSTKKSIEKILANKVMLCIMPEEITIKPNENGSVDALLLFKTI